MNVRETKHIVATGEDGEELRVIYSNRGEPYREGCAVELMLATDEWTPSVSIFLEAYELKKLRDSLSKLLGDNGADILPGGAQE